MSSDDRVRRRKYEPENLLPALRHFVRARNAALAQGLVSDNGVGRAHPGYFEPKRLLPSRGRRGHGAERRYPSGQERNLHCGVRLGSQPQIPGSS